MSSILENFSNWLDVSSVAVAFAAIVTILQTIYFTIRSRKDIAVSYRVSVIGLPRAGKTALISAIFDHIFHSTTGTAFAPVGEATINKINNQILVLESRKVFEPTKEEDAFIFRFLYYVRRFFFIARIRYEGEVVDFPGEMSAALMRSADDGSISDDIALFQKEFYSWILSSKVHIFVIDLAQFFLSENRSAFAAARAAEIRKTWQVLNEEIHRAQRSEDRRIALVFSKADLSSYISFVDGAPFLEDHTVEKIRRYGYDRAPLVTDTELMRSVSPLDFEKYVQHEFRSILEYFRSQNGKFNLFFTSSYKDVQGNRTGISDLVQFVLPKGNF